MQKIFIKVAIPFIIAFIVSCGKESENVIESNSYQYQVWGLKNIPNILFNTQDSSVTLSIYFNSDDGINKVFAEIYDPSNNKIFSESIQLFDDGSQLNRDDTKRDYRYSNYFYLSQSNQSGKYQIEYYVLQKNEVLNKVALQYFNFNNNIQNQPPALRNLVLTDSLQREQSFIFSVEAIDLNGLNDIKLVYFQLFRPDGTAVIDTRTGSTKFQMFDDGNFLVYGDNIANDGIFSFKNYFSNTAQTGNWKFVFGAEDKGGLLSNTIEKEVLVY